MLEWIERPIPVSRQCQLLGIGRSTVYYEAEPVSTEDLQLMRVIDEQYLKTPFYGSRRMTFVLREAGYEINRKRIQRLMRVMGLEGLAPGPSTSKPHKEHVKYPYLLRGLQVGRANQVWAADITYIPMAHGFGYLVAIIDWYSRCVLAWRLSNTLDVNFCLEALEEALSRGRPEIFNTDQGVQFTSDEFTQALRNQGIQISMDGKGRCLDNVFVERLWRSLKYEEIYLHAYQSFPECRSGIGAYLNFYNYERPHQALNYQRPGQVYKASIADSRRE